MEKERFHEILNEVAEIYRRQSDPGGDGLSSFRMCERMGVPAWKGVLVMMAEEIGRLMNMARLENIEAESQTVAGTLTELAAHSIMARMVLEEPGSVKQLDYGPRRGRRPGQREKKDAVPENLIEVSPTGTGEE